MSEWFAVIGVNSPDVVAIKKNFPLYVIGIEENDGETLLSSPRLIGGNVDEMAAAAAELINNVNVALRVVEPRYRGIELTGVAQRQNGRLHRTMFAEAGAYGLSAVAAVGMAGSIGPRMRSVAERLMDLMERDERIRDAARVLAARPLTWPGLTMVYETITGLMSAKSNPEKARGDWQNLVAQGWLQTDEAARFYNTAAYHRKGYPKSPIRGGQPALPFDDGEKLVRRLFEKVVDVLQPN